jgi:hypothetical protein
VDARLRLPLRIFASCPLLLAAVAAPFVRQTLLTKRQTWFLSLFFVLFWGFFSSVNYTRLQYNTGVRYMAPMIPVLFLTTAAVLSRLSRPVLYGVTVAAVAQAWCMAMYRDVERGHGVADPLLHVLLGGFQLPRSQPSCMNLGLEALAGGFPCLFALARPFTASGGGREGPARQSVSSRVRPQKGRITTAPGRLDLVTARQKGKGWHSRGNFDANAEQIVRRWPARLRSTKSSLPPLRSTVGSAPI